MVSCVQINPTTIRISDLPAKRWTATYKEFLDQMAKPPRRGRRALIKGFKEHHTENSVDFHVYLTRYVGRACERATRYSSPLSHRALRLVRFNQHSLASFSLLSLSLSPLQGANGAG